MVEASTTFRTLALLAIYMFGICSKCILRLSRCTPSIIEWRALRILFIIGNQRISVLLTLYLGMVFYLLINCNSGSILTPGKIPWTIYIFFPLIGVLTTVIIVILFQLLIFANTESTKLKLKWISFCGNSLFCQSNRFKMKILCKTLRSTQSIAFSYGSLGTFTKATRADYFHSIAVYSANATLAFRNYV